MASEIIASNDFVVSGFEYYGGELYSVIVSAHFSIKNAFLSIILWTQSKLISVLKLNVKSVSTWNLFYI